MPNKIQPPGKSPQRKKSTSPGFFVTGHLNILKTTHFQQKKNVFLGGATTTEKKNLRTHRSRRRGTVR